MVGTVMLENVPQLILQLMYMVHIGKPTQAVIVAFIASLLSGTATTLSYLIETDDEELRPVEYYISMQCQRMNNNSLTGDDSDSNPGLTVKSHKTNKILTKIKPVIVSDNSNYHHLTSKENESIIENRGRTQALGVGLSKLFQIQPKNIEIGSTLIHKTGITTHVIHMIYQSEIEIMEAELFKGGMQIKISPHFYTQQLFQSLEKEINELFCDHFGLSANFAVQYNDFAGVKKRAMSIAPNNDNKKLLLQKMVSHTQLSLNTPNTNSLEDELRKFISDGEDELESRKQRLIKMFENIASDQSEMERDESSIIQNNKDMAKFNLTELHNEIKQGSESDTEYSTSHTKDDDDDEKSENGYLLDDKENDHQKDENGDIGDSVALEMVSILNTDSKETGVELNKEISDLIVSQIEQDKE